MLGFLNPSSINISSIRKYNSFKYYFLITIKGFNIKTLTIIDHVHSSTSSDESQDLQGVLA
jgi:hypothetical protein